MKLTKRLTAVILILLVICVFLYQRLTRLSDWERHEFTPTDNKALVWYEVYGQFAEGIKLHSKEYRCQGIPEGVEIQKFNVVEHKDFVEGFRSEGPIGKILKESYPQQYETFLQTPEKIVIRGELDDPCDLNYLRDCIGLVTYLLDNGGEVVLDTQVAQWYDKSTWHETIFYSESPTPTDHVWMYYSIERGDKSDSHFWIHTRGMRKFARPDVSLTNVPEHYFDSSVELCKRLIQSQGFGISVQSNAIINTVRHPHIHRQSHSQYFFLHSH